MGEKTNNAVEKVERIIRNKKHPKTAYGVKKSVQNTDARTEKERIQAERRIEMARIRARKKAEKQKAKAMALREKNRKKSERQLKRQETKAELQLKRQQINAERQAKKQERKAEKMRLREKRKTQNKGFGGWLAAVITLSVATLVLASVLTFTFLMPTTTDGMLESTYRKSFYDTVEQVDNIDLNLSKILASKDTGAIQKYLVDTAINSELAENDIQQLPLQDESKFYTTKLINQIGDYSKYLNNKLADGGSLSEKDRENLASLYRSNLALKNALGDMIGQMGDDFSFKTVLDGGSGNLVISGFNDLQNLSVEYPELIYDGPFSDGQDNREIKGLSGDDIDANKAKDIFKSLFGSYSLENIANDGTTGGDIECFNVMGEKDGEVLYAQISKKGGKLVMFSYAGSCNAVNVMEDKAVETAKEFLTSLGLENMKAVWINLTGNVYTINFAYEQNDTVVYSDLIKVRVCAETDTVIGIEAKNYYTNHTERNIGAPAISQAKASESVSENIGIITCRLALVPIGSSAEKLCYEFSGEYDGSTYYVYIDATNGKQVEMFKVIHSTEGELLI
ncbi:MAG: germination protein YpeB [Clostridia bacterium]|nr:germination protein YpeB [Clostridia bacterium]